MKKNIVAILLLSNLFCTAQVKWMDTRLFEQKNFIENKGQFDLVQLPNKETVLFAAKIDGVTWYFTKSGYTIERVEIVN